MNLIPKKFKFKRIFKRRIISIKKKVRYSVNGDISLILSSPSIFSASTIVKLKLFFKRIFKKKLYPLSKLWFPLFPALPVTKKVQGSRMGKGKGKFCAWFIKKHSNTILCEYKNIKSAEFYKQIPKVKARISKKIFIVYKYI